MAPSIEPSEAEDLRRQRVIGQLRRIRSARPDIRIEPPDWETTADLDYMYRADSVLVMDDAPPDVLRRLPPHRLIARNGFSRLTFDSPVDVPTLVRTANTGVGRQAVAPDHVMHVAAYSICPAVEPASPAVIRTPGEAPWQPVPNVVRAVPGAPVRVDVIDTGVSADAIRAHAWLANVSGEPEYSFTSARRDGTAGTDIAEYAGHGTFTAGVLAAAAPNAVINVTGGLDVRDAATVFESDLVHDVLTRLLAAPPGVLLINAGFNSFDDTEPLTVTRIGDLVSRLTDTVVVCPAGNYGNDRPFWPAASSWAVGVGALNEEQDRQCGWSNVGGWVDIYARSFHLNAFLTGSYVTREPQTPAGDTRDFAGMAVWGGTSFAAPVVAGKIAQAASVAGSTTTAAWQSLKAAADAATPRGGAPYLPTDTESVPTFPVQGL